MKSNIRGGLNGARIDYTIYNRITKSTIMHAFLLIGQNQESLEKNAREISNKLNSVFMPYTVEKIADVRNLIHLTNLKLSKTTLFVKDINLATTESLNAFLKNLEEAQENLSIILTATNVEAVLPTIVSRVQIIRIGNKPEVNSEIARTFLDSEDWQRLGEAKKVKGRDEALIFIEKLIHSLNSLLLETKNLQKIANALQKAEKTKKALHANANVGLQLANFAINL